MHLCISQNRVIEQDAEEHETQRNDLLPSNGCDPQKAWLLVVSCDLGGLRCGSLRSCALTGRLVNLQAAQTRDTSLEVALQERVDGTSSAA